MRYLIKKITPMLAIIIAIGCAVSLAACSGMSGAEVVVTINDNVRAEDFCLEDAFIELINKRGKVDTINITPDMLSADDLAKLSNPGRHTVTVNYKKNKSITADINLLRDVEDTDTVMNKVIQGLIKSAPGTNINGELKAAAYYEIGGHRKEYGISLRFTLDADSEAGTDSYLGLEITENSNVIFAVYYKDSKTERPYLYLKFDGPFVPLMPSTENKFKSVSVDGYFGGAVEPLANEFLQDQSLKGIMDLITTLVSNEAVENLVTMVLQMVLTNPAVADDNSAATVDIDLGTLATLVPLVVLIPEINNTANDFLSANDADFSLIDVLTSLETPPVLRLNALFDNVTGALQKLDISDKKGNLSIFPMLQINIEGKGEAGLSVEKLAIKADKSSFQLPTDKGIEKWAEAEVSFERWVLLQYRRMLGNPVRPANRAGTTNYLDIDYVGNANPYQYLDVYRPAEKSGERLPVIINIHGGGWVHGAKEGSYSYCQYLALQGFAVVNINYHLIPAAVMPVPMQDIFAAFNFVMDADNAALYGFDTDNVFLTGDSAGGHYAILALSVLADPALASVYGVSSNIRFAAAGVNSTGFSFTDILKIPLPFAHFYVNQFFSDDLPYTAYRDDPRYQAMAASLNLENNKLELLPPMFISSADGDGFNAHSDMLAAELRARGVEYIYDFRYQNDMDNPERFFLGHDFNISFPDWTISRKVNNRMCSFFMAHIT